jgi:peptide/nickel transport system substrate-binding protein
MQYVCLAGMLRTSPQMNRIDVEEKMAREGTNLAGRRKQGGRPGADGPTRRSVLAGGLASSVLLALSPAARAQQGKVLRIGVVTLGSGVGLVWKTTGDSVFLPNLAEEPLLIEGQHGDYEPRLAREFSISDDGGKVTFKLQQGVQFHDGQGEMTSADVKFAFEKLMAPGSQSTVGPTFRAAIASVEAPDPYTVIVNIKPGKGTFDFLDNFNGNYPRFQVTSEKYVAKAGEEAASRKWVGTGPWKLESFKSGEVAEFSAVKNHWRRPPAFDRLSVRAVPDAATQKLMLQAGDLDIIPCSGDSIEELKQAGFRLISSRGHPLYVFFGGMYLTSREGFNPKLPWVADPADAKAWERARLVRLAMNYAVDKEAIFQTILAGQGEITAVPSMLPSYPGYDPAWKPYPYDVAKAKDLLREAGYPNGFQCTVRQYRLAGRDAIWYIAAVLPSYFEKIGIHTRLEQVDYTAVMAPQQRARKLDSLCLYGIAKQEAMTAWAITGGSFSEPCWLPETPWLDEKISKGLRTFNRDARLALTREIAQYYMANAATIPIGSQDVIYAVNPEKVKSWPLPPGVTAPLVNTELIR